MTMASTPSGTFTQNTLRQPNWCTRMPPIKGPDAPATPTSADQAPSMRVRSRSSSKLCVSRLSELGMNRAAPAPCSRRAAVKKCPSGAAPHNTEPRIKMPRPPWYTAFGP